MSDHNYKSFSGLEGFTVINIEVSPEDPRGFDDTLKLSACSHFEFDGGRVAGGRENAVDVNNRCAQGLFNHLRLVGGDQASIVVKGGSKGIVFADCVLEPSPKSWCDVLIDDWSDQSQDSSTVLLKNLTRADGRPVRVVAGRGVWPSIIGGNVRCCRIYSLCLRCYNSGKGLLRKLKLV